MGRSSGSALDKPSEGRWFALSELAAPATKSKKGSIVQDDRRILSSRAKSRDLKNLKQRFARSLHVGRDDKGVGSE